MSLSQSCQILRFANMSCLLPVPRYISRTKPCLRCMCTRSQTLTNDEVRVKRNELFNKEKKRQLELISRIEKIQVDHVGPPENCTLIMNKGISTPFNCAMHIQELLMKRSVVALVNGKLWDMHRPLVEDCELRFLHFKDDNPSLSNKVFWRSCSYILGHILETAFKSDYKVELCSFPAPDVRSGSIVYDVDLNMTDWKPKEAELSAMSRIGAQLYYDDLRFERLDVDASLALHMFEDNRFKVKQVPEIASQSGDGSVTIYRMGDHIDMSRGPMMSSTALIGRFSVSSVHNIESPDYGQLSRVQGVAMPTQFVMHQWTFNFLTERARTLNRAPPPSLHQYDPKAQNQHQRS